MSEPIVLASFGLDEDLNLITSHLWANSMGHRVVEQGDQQILILADADDAPQAQQWIDLWQAGKLEAPAPAKKSVNRTTLLAFIQTAPITLVCCLGLIAVFVFQQFSDTWHLWLVLGEQYWPATRNHPQVLIELGVWPVWRLSLLHFSFMHLISNLVWFWVMGKHIEQKDGKMPLLLLIVISSYLGNLAQWWFSGPAFGGASGITMAMLAFVGWRQLQKKVNYSLPSLLLPLMVGWMLLSIFAENLFNINSQTSHATHLAGLFCGLVLALLVPKKQVQPQES